MQIDNVHENEHVLRMSQHLCELLPDQRERQKHMISVPNPQRHSIQSWLVTIPIMDLDSLQPIG